MESRNSQSHQPEADDDDRCANCGQCRCGRRGGREAASELAPVAVLSQPAPATP